MNEINLFFSLFDEIISVGYYYSLGLYWNAFFTLLWNGDNEFKRKKKQINKRNYHQESEWLFFSFSYPLVNSMVQMFFFWSVKLVRDKKMRMIITLPRFLLKLCCCCCCYQEHWKNGDDDDGETQHYLKSMFWIKHGIWFQVQIFELFVLSFFLFSFLHSLLFQMERSRDSQKELEKKQLTKLNEMKKWFWLKKKNKKLTNKQTKSKEWTSTRFDPFLIIIIIILVKSNELKKMNNNNERRKKRVN